MTDPRPAAAADQRGDGSPTDAADPDGGPAPAAATFACPACGHALPGGDADESGILTCATCGAEFFAAADPADDDRALADRLEADRRRREQSLNDVRIRQVLTERRALFRTRSYFVVLASLAAVAAGQVGIFAARRLAAHGFNVRVAAYLIAVAGLLYAAWACAGRVRSYSRELAEPAVGGPAAEPDFSTLSDGSQRVYEAAANLERLSGRG